MTRAKLNPTNSQFSAWLEIFNSKYVDVISPMPIGVKLNGTTKLGYMVDLDKITDNQRDKIIRHLAHKYNLDRKLVENLMPENGVCLPDDAVEFVVSDETALLLTVMD